MEKEKKEFKISEEEYLKLKRSKEKTKALTIVLIFTVVVMIGLIVLLCLGKGDKTNDKGGSGANNQPTVPTNQPANQDNPINITVKKSVDRTDYTAIVDTNGNAYLGGELYEDIAQTYNYNGKTSKLFKLDINNIKDVQALIVGNGEEYIVFLDNNDSLFVSINGNTRILTHDKVSKVTKVYNDCVQDGCGAYAKAIRDGKEQTVDLHELFEKDN